MIMQRIWPNQICSREYKQWRVIIVRLNLELSYPLGLPSGENLLCPMLSQQGKEPKDDAKCHGNQS
jgi:hypothetical protein